MAKALLIIDMQRFVEDRINKGVGYYPSDAISNMRHLLNKYKKTICWSFASFTRQTLPTVF
jgi:isochorismate hydrolase